MKTRLALLLSVLAVFGAQAADHTDAPATMADPSADLNDFYLFVNPGDADEVIGILTLHPLATGASQFSDAVIYDMWFSADASAGASVQCRFDAEQRIRCTGPGGVVVEGHRETVLEGEGMRVWAGLADDPFFFDLQAFRDTASTGTVAFTDPGTDFFAGLNTLAIVVGIDRALFAASGDVQKAYVSSARVAGTGITDDVDGFWWSGAEAGRGWHFDVFPGDDGARFMGAAYFGFDAMGERYWLVGQGPVTGNTVTMEMVHGSGGSFVAPIAAGSVDTPVQGTAVIAFEGCNAATIEFTPAEDSTLTLPGTFVLDNRPAGDFANCQFFLDTGQEDTFGKAHLAFQKDRNGRPAIATALIPAELKDAYNAAADPATWAEQFADEMAASLAVFDGLDGVDGNLLLGDEAALAGVLADDRLVIDSSVASCGAYLAVELAGGGAPAACGGRTLTVDVIDATLGAAVGSPVSDGVDANDRAFREDFPFLAPPN